jgi:hypothetical protein
MKYKNGVHCILYLTSGTTLHNVKPFTSGFELTSQRERGDGMATPGGNEGAEVTGPTSRRCGLRLDSLSICPGSLAAW